ncbi:MULTISPECIES: hypothetical protein [unclassified Schlesneria]|uniref:hypothetical protein n=1 Tax=unclassified Schlesneria TaxID=2762017 RepID=UPI002F00FFF8
MHWQFKLGTPLLLTVVGFVTVSPAWSAEKVTPKAPAKIRLRSSEPRSAARAPAAPAKVETPSAEAEAEAAESDSKVTQASFSSTVVLMDTTVDPNVGNDGQVVPNQLPDPHAAKLRAKSRDCYYARLHRASCDVVNTEKENARDWFNYIRGYGPVVWVRNGPELSCHPPSIPFAKRIGGATAPQWGGVTGVPVQREISPHTVYVIQAEDLQYRVFKVAK